MLMVKLQIIEYVINYMTDLYFLFDVLIKKTPNNI